MWFFRGKPKLVLAQTVVESLPKGYQRTSCRFRLEADETKTKDGKLFIGFPFPWSSNKRNGSILIEDTTNESYFNTDCNEIQQLTSNDFEILEKVKVLKTNKDCELMNIQDFIYWHVEDVGVIVTWVDINKFYQVSYIHKIGYDSQLFVPTRYPVSVSSNPEFQVKHSVCVVDGRVYVPPKYLRKVHKENNKDYYEFESWSWDEDTRFPTNNWESSDDECDSDN